MPTLNNPEYYRRREQQERMLAAAAQSREIQLIHTDLADRYLALIEAARPRPERPQLRLVISGA